MPSVSEWCQAARRYSTGTSMMLAAARLLTVIDVTVLSLLAGWHHSDSLDEPADSLGKGRTQQMFSPLLI